MSFQDIEAGRPLNSRHGGGGYNNGGIRKQDPTQAVASGIFQINTAVSTFQRLVNTLGTPKDTPELREKLYVLFNFNSIIIFRVSYLISLNYLLLTCLMRQDAVLSV